MATNGNALRPPEQETRPHSTETIEAFNTCKTGRKPSSILHKSKKNLTNTKLNAEEMQLLKHGLNYSIE
jgi:hypothetical protein